MNTRAAAALALAAWLAVPGLARALPGFAEVRRDFRSSETRVFDRHGELIQRLRTDARVRRGDWVPLAEVSPALRQALVLPEDRRFYEHSGVDWRAVGAAAFGNLWNSRTRGASTLTMQLAGLLDEDYARGPGGRGVARKIGQAAAALRLEADWRKDEILEAYLNLVPFRGEIAGIDALSRTLFGKAAHGLDAREAAITAALVRAPNAAAAAVGARACAVLRDMRASEDCAAVALVTEAALQRRAFEASEGIAPHFARQLLKELPPGKPPAQVRGTLSAPLQRLAIETLGQHLRELSGRNVEDGALVVLDNASGEVLAWVGSSGGLSRAAEVDGVLAPRQPGSTLKPFLYAQAIAEQRLTAASLIEDSPAQIAAGEGLYIPQNYDRRFRGLVSVRGALASSLNVPAVRTLVMLTPEAFAAQLDALGLPLKESGGYYGYSLALGSPDFSLLALTNAYRALANGGRASATRRQPSPAPNPGRAVLPPGAAFIVGDILADNNARAQTFGADSVLATRIWTAVKTGTSKDMRDNWALGWSSHYTVGVWVGNASGAPMHDVSGTSGAAPVWAAVMAWLHANQRSEPPRPPPGLVRAAVRFADDARAPGLEASRDEWFLAGTEQQVFATESEAGRGRSTYRSGLKDAQRQAARARIAEPVAGTIIALDPDIPPARQRLLLRAEGPAQALQWRMDGKPIGLGGQLAWNPWPGRHRLTLAQHGRVVDEVRLEVRGAGVRPRGNTAQARSYSQGGAPPAGSSTRQYTLGQASPSGVASDGGTGSRSSVRITSTAPQRASMP